MKVYTIGYEGATQDEVIGALRRAGIKMLADIRAVPLSRRPGFSKNVLAASLKEAGIGYVGLKALGTPPEGREAARKGNIARLKQIYAEQLETLEAGIQAAELITIAKAQPTALLCFERDPAACHRSLLIEAIFPNANQIDLFAQE